MVTQDRKKVKIFTIQVTLLGHLARNGLTLAIFFVKVIFYTYPKNVGKLGLWMGGQR